MKKLVLFCTTLLLYLHGISQFPLHDLLPLGVSDISYGDTLLNTTAVLKREGIKKITSHQLLSDNTNKSSWTTEYLVTDGRIEAKRFCFRRAPENDYTFCNSDTILYDSKGQIQEFRARDGKGNVYVQSKTEYTGEGRLRYTWIMSDPKRAILDTTIYYHIYNEKKQLIRQEQEAKQYVTVNASLYYNEDGLPDSIKHDNPAWGTYVFQRKQKSKTKEIKLETSTTRYKWVYNSSGQCVFSEWSLKRPVMLPNQPKKKLSAETKYDYNVDGTLSKVEEKRTGNKIITTIYSYGR